MDLPACQHPHRRGFTLVEALITLAVLGTLLGLMVPAMGEVIQSVRLSNVTNEVWVHLQLARSEAIKRNGRVALCKSAGGDLCVAQARWDQGWILFHDHNNNGQREPRETILQRLRPLPTDFRLQANTNVARYVSYGPYGNTRLVSGAFQAGAFTVCRVSAEPVDARRIVINSGGRPRIEKARVDSCA